MIAPKYKLGLMASLIAAACFSIYFFHLFIAAGTVITHIFYVPIVLASIWWGRKGLIVAVFSAAFLIFSHAFLSLDALIISDYFRVAMFLVIGFIIGELSERTAREEQQQLRAANQQLKAANQQLQLDITERKKAEQTLRNSEKKNRAWLEHSPACTKIVDLDLNLQYMSTAGIKGLGIDDITQFYGKPYPFDFYPESFRNNMIKNLEQVRETGQVITQEAPVVDTDGNELWLHSTLVPVNDDDGRIDYIIVVSIEITERKRAEQKAILHLAELKFLSTTAMEFVDLQPETDVYELVATRLKELVGDPIVVISSSDETNHEVVVRAIVGVGKRFEAALNILGKNPVGMSFPILESFLRQTASGKLVKLSEGIQHYTRKKIPKTAAKLIEKTLGLGDLYSMQFSRGGRILAFATIVMRKGERLENPGLIETYINHASVLLHNRQAEDVLRQSEDRYRAIAEDMPGMICRFLPGCEITYVNEACCRCFGKTSENLVGSSFLSLIPEADRETVATNISALTVQSPTQSHEHRVIGPDGQIRWHSWTNRATFDNEGMVLAYQSVGEDITERKQAEENLLWYQERLRFLASELAQAEERTRHRIATDLHDGVGQDLLSLKMELEKIRKAAPSTELDNTLGQMIETIENMIQTTRSLMLELSPPVLYELGLVPAIEWLTEKTQTDHAIGVSFHDDGQDKQLNDGVRVGLFRAIRELLINVVKHAQASNIEITSRRDGPNIRVLVKDDGIGFDPVETQFPKDLRSGMGLFYIRERLAHLGGVFDLESKPGQGTIATLIAPIKD